MLFTEAPAKYLEFICSELDKQLERFGVDADANYNWTTNKYISPHIWYKVTAVERFEFYFTRPIPGKIPWHAYYTGDPLYVLHGLRTLKTGANIEAVWQCLIGEAVKE